MVVEWNMTKQITKMEVVVFIQEFQFSMKEGKGGPVAIRESILLMK